MKNSCHKKTVLNKVSKYKGILFHIVGIGCIIWFLIRVIPKPDRIRYPCQQMSITVALTYIAFWAALFTGLQTINEKYDKYYFSVFHRVTAIYIPMGRYLTQHGS